MSAVAEPSTSADSASTASSDEALDFGRPNAWSSSAWFELVREDELGERQARPGTASPRRKSSFFFGS